MFPSQSSNCWRCAAPRADFMHICWHCMASQQFWFKVVGCVQSVTTININPSVEICLFGLIELLAPTKVICAILTLFFYYAQKIIILSWKKTCGPYCIGVEGIC